MAKIICIGIDKMIANGTVTTLIRDKFIISDLSDFT